MNEKQILDSVIESLSHLFVGDDGRRGLVWPKARIEAFDGFEMFVSGLFTGDYILTTTPGDAPVWPMDARWAFKIIQSKKLGFHDGWLFKRVSTLNPANWRGKLTRVMPRMVEHHEFFVQPNGKAVGSVAPIALLGSRVAISGARSHPLAGVRISHNQVYETTLREADPENEAHDIGLAHGVMLRREYLWSVLLGESGIPRARFVTDAIGVREAFRLRDIPPGKRRRAALRHWVREHWRKNNRESESDRIWIRAHLRGATEFAWNGLRCGIEPSMHDQRKAKIAK